MSCSGCPAASAGSQSWQLTISRSKDIFSVGKHLIEAFQPFSVAAVVAGWIVFTRIRRRSASTGRTYLVDNNWQSGSSRRGPTVCCLTSSSGLQLHVSACVLLDMHAK
jgi:hypothetical protein